MSQDEGTIITVDGPAASGKSTIARGLAQALKFRYINSGSFYRALAYGLLKRKIDLASKGDVDTALDAFTLGCDEAGQKYSLGSDDVSRYLRRRDVSVHAARVAQIARVREKVNRELRRIADGHDCVVEGRDIGTVVFPTAKLKVYLEASLEERARRRLGDYKTEGDDHRIEEIISELKERDDMDSTRSIAPLRPPEGAVVVNSTRMTPEEVVGHILALLREHKEVGRGAGSDKGGMASSSADS